MNFLAAVTSTTDLRGRMHTISESGETLCGTDAPFRINRTVGSLDRKECFFCTALQEQKASAQTEDAPAEEPTVQLRMASVISDYLIRALADGATNLTKEAGDSLTAALASAEVIPMGHGAQHRIELARDVAEAVHIHLFARLASKKPGVGIQRWRLERAVKMIGVDLAA